MKNHFTGGMIFHKIEIAYNDQVSFYHKYLPDCQSARKAWRLRLYIKVQSEPKRLTPNADRVPGLERINNVIIHAFLPGPSRVYPFRCGFDAKASGLSFV